MQAVLELMGQGKLDVKPLITHRFSIDAAETAYAMLKNGTQPYLGIVLKFPDCNSRPVRKIELKASGVTGKLNVGCVGAGGFGRMVLIPAIRRIDSFHLKSVCSAGGLSAVTSAGSAGFDVATSDEDEIIQDPLINAVFILTRHNQHARQVIKCLRAGKHVFVEKPLALTVQQLIEIENVLDELGPKAPLLTVGFNRRFSPAAATVKEFFAPVSGPIAVSIRFNAGCLPKDHWTQDEAVGGGRIIGEACHAIDLATYLTGSPVSRVFAESIGGPEAPFVTDDQCFITLRHANGSISSIAYLAGGDKDFSKERVEVLGGGRIAVIDDFREVVLSHGGKRLIEKYTQDKGHNAEVAAFAEAIRMGGPAPISWEDLYCTSLASILAMRSLREGLPVHLGSAADDDQFMFDASKQAA
jgi:predicted dehydrogenase